jgi:hypothetical protein
VSKFDFLMVVCVGRSGSTLVQGLLNAVPGVLIRGENGFFLHELFRAYRRAAVAKKSKGSQDKMEPTSPWFGANLLRPDALARRLGEAAVEQLCHGEAASTVGFKEIRWGQLGVREAGHFVHFCELAFGRCGWVLHTRPPEQVRLSGWWRDAPARKSRAACRHVEKLHDFLRHKRPEACFDSSLDCIKSDLSSWASRLLGWGGWQSEGVIERMREVARVRHSYAPLEPREGGSVE